MQEGCINNNVNSSNYNINNIIKNDLSLSQVLSEVSQMLSVCRSVQCSESSDVTHCLPILDTILSEISGLVSVVQDQRLQQQELPASNDEMMWDSEHDFLVYSEVSASCSDVSVTSSDVSFSSDSNTSYVDSEAEERQLMQEIFVGNMLEAISRAAPNSVFNREKSERKRKKKLMNRFVPRVFQCMWRYWEAIFTPHTPATTQPDNIIRPTVNWEKVNGRFFNNLPKPEQFPVLGCSQDPTFYQESYRQYDNRPTMTIPAKHDTPYPFGQKSGYMTQFGVVSLSSSVGDLSIPFQGYIYDKDQGWVIHANNPWMKDKKMKEMMKPMKMMSQKMKMKSPRRRLH